MIRISVSIKGWTMAYASSLPDEKFSEIYDQIEKHVSASAEAAYKANLAMAKTEKQRRACAGHYPSDWSIIFDLWCRDRIPNTYVIDCLRLGHVHAPDASAKRKAQK